MKKGQNNIWSFRVKCRNMERNRLHWNSPIGNLLIEEDDKGISRISFCGDDKFWGKENITPLLERAIEELDEYFRGQRTVFDVPLSLNGTEFQKTVWRALQRIPYGETKSYSDIAIMVNNPKAVRAVGMANNKNPIMIMVPCHRVIGKNGKLVGYAAGLDVKKKLLELEHCRYK